MARPQRLSIPDFSGRSRTLAEGPTAWQKLSSGSAVLFLGLGSGPAGLPDSLLNSQVFWLDDPKLLAQTHSAEHLPSTWVKVNTEEARALFSSASVYFYRQNLLLSPSFFGPLLGRLQAETWSHACKDPRERYVFLPGNDYDLLHQELRCALHEEGWQVVTPGRDTGMEYSESRMEELCHGIVPSFSLNINARGLDAEGRIFFLFRALHVPCAIWFVDNPWHVLSRIKLPWWKEAHLFITDPSFIPSLREAGASSVSFLPLAFAPQMWLDLPDFHERSAKARPTFVGRSAFPDKTSYFSAVNIPHALCDEALALLARHSPMMPDIHWWYRRIPCELWPGSGARTPGAGAELCAQKNRVDWLSAGLSSDLRIIGDSGWNDLLDGVRIDPPVDYYTQLPQLYHEALAILNVTSLQLPASLSQRHFDVWAAGGILLSDPTPGLSLFPQELTQPITVPAPGALAAKIEEVRREPDRFQKLASDFRAHLLSHHSYRHRIKEIVAEILP